MRSRRARKLAQAGMSLIEVAMVLSVAGLVVASALRLYSNAHTTQRTAAALNQMNAIQQSVRRIYGNQASFSNVSLSVLADSKMLPGMVTSTGVLNSFGGVVDVTPFAVAGTGAGIDGYQIAFQGVPSDACVSITTKDYGDSLFQLQVNDTEFARADGLPNPVDAASACGALPSTLTWKFRN